MRSISPRLLEKIEEFETRRNQEMDKFCSRNWRHMTFGIKTNFMFNPCAKTDPFLRNSDILTASKSTCVLKKMASFQFLADYFAFLDFLHRRLSRRDLPRACRFGNKQTQNGMTTAETAHAAQTHFRPRNLIESLVKGERLSHPRTSFACSLLL